MPPETTTGKLLSSPSSEYLKKSPSPIKLKPKPPTFWVLFLSGLALFLLAAALAVSHFLSTPKSVPPPTDKKIPIPYANQPEIWKPFRQWVIQEDGRNKPFETFSREVVRTVTGREKFE